LNHLLFQHQVAVLQASGHPPAFGHRGFDLVRHYQTRIDRLRSSLGAALYPDWFGIPVSDIA